MITTEDIIATLTTAQDLLLGEELPSEINVRIASGCTATGTLRTRSAEMDVLLPAITVEAVEEDMVVTYPNGATLVTNLEYLSIEDVAHNIAKVAERATRELGARVDMEVAVELENYYADHMYDDMYEARK